MTQYYIFAGFIGLLAFALLFWYKRTPRERLPRKEAEELAEKEAKLFRLYQNLEDMMDSFESYVEQQTDHIGKQAAGMAGAEKRVDELADRIETALTHADGRWGEASSMLDKAELLATELSGRINRNMTELDARQKQAADDVEKAITKKAAEVDRAIAKKVEDAKKEAEKLVFQQAEFAVQPLQAQTEQPAQRILEPIIARPSGEADDDRPVYTPTAGQTTAAQAAIQPMQTSQNIQVVQAAQTAQATHAVHPAPSNADVPFTPIAGSAQTANPAQPTNEMQAQLLKKLVEAKKNRQAQAEVKPAAAEAPRFDATVPEYNIRANSMPVAAGSEKYATYTRPAPMQKQASASAAAAPMAGAQMAAAPMASAPVQAVSSADYPAAANEEQSRKQQVLDLYKDGMSAEEISRQLGVAKGAISFILDLQGKLQ